MNFSIFKLAKIFLLILSLFITIPTFCTIQAQNYSGEWRGTTQDGKTVYFHVSSNNTIDSINVVYTASYGQYDLTTPFRQWGPNSTIQDNNFRAKVGSSFLLYSSGSSSDMIGTFTSSTTCSGIIDTFRINGIMHPDLVIFGSAQTQSQVGFTASRTTPISEPIADFTGNPITGIKPLLVQFTDASTGQITNRSWNFGDGQSSTAVSPSHTYTNAGTYTVQLTVTGPGGSNIKTRTNYISVTDPSQTLNPPLNLQASLVSEQVTLTWDPPSSITGAMALLQGFPREIKINSPLTRQTAGLKKVNPIMTTTLDNITEVEPNDDPDQAQVLEGLSPVSVNGNAEVSDAGNIIIEFENGMEDDVEDLFFITTYSEGLSISLTDVSSDLDVYLFQINGSSITIVGGSLATGIVNESIELPTLPAGNYYIGVTIFDLDPIGPNSSPYILTVTGDLGGELAGLLNYNIYRSSTPNATETGTVIGTTLPGTTNFVDDISSQSVAGFYYQVTAVYDAGESEATNEVFVDNMTAPEIPVLLSPVNNAVNQSTILTLNWNQSLEAETYHLQVSTTSDFAVTVVNEDSIPTTSKQVGLLSNNITYYWRVSANNNGSTSEWSEIWNFKTIVGLPDKVQLQSPPDNSINQQTDILLSWNQSTGAETYHLQVSTTSDFAAIVVNDDSIPITSYEIGHLSNNTTYYWRVNARNPGGTVAWSEVWSFTTIINLPNQVLLLLPPDNTLLPNDTVHFTWHQCAPEISKYWFEMAADSAMTNPVVDSMLTGVDTNKIVNQLLSSQTYWWRVKAGNAAGWGPFSMKRKFTTVITDIDITNDIPREFSLSQNHPNPFNPSTRIRYSISQTEFVTLKIYDILGNEITTLVNEEKPAGYYEVEFDGNNLSSGVYLYKIEAGSFTETKKLVLLR